MPRRRAGHHAAARARRLHRPANTVLPPFTLYHPLFPRQRQRASQKRSTPSPPPLASCATPQQSFPPTRTERGGEGEAAVGCQQSESWVGVGVGGGEAVEIFVMMLEWKPKRVHGGKVRFRG